MNDRWNPVQGAIAYYGEQGVFPELFGLIQSVWLLCWKLYLIYLRLISKERKEKEKDKGKESGILIGLTH